MMSRVLCALVLTWVCEAAVFEETFPLSGGFTAGMKVHFKATLLSGDAHVDFLTPERSVRFRWSVNTTTQVVSRSIPGNVAEEWGGYPFAPGAVNFEFTRTKSHWAASVMGKRTPWFDFMASDSLITHAKVHGAWEDVEVLQTRPVCDVQCHPNECSCAGGACYSIQGESCSPSMHTGAVMDSSCCEGRPAILDLEAVEVEDYVQLLSDTALIQEACSAFQADAACSLSKLQGSKLRIQSVNLTTKIVTAYSTVRAGDSEPSSVEFPYYILTDSPVVKKFVDIMRTEMQTALVDLILEDGLINKVEGSAIAEGIEKYWYVNMMTTHKGTDEWFQYFGDRWKFARDSVEADGDVIHLVLSDGIIGTTNCTDRLAGGGDFVDASGNTCADYESKNFCTKEGQPAAGWTYGGNLYSQQNGVASAPWWCCACGGGYLDRPDDLITTTTVPPSAAVSQQMLVK